MVAYRFWIQHPKKEEIKGAILAGLIFGLAFGTFKTIEYNLKEGLISGTFSGFFFGLLMYFFVTSRVIKKQTQINIPEGQMIIHSGGANHFLSGEGVGGKLYLLSDRLQFKSHSFNIQNHQKTIAISQIEDVNFFNTLGFIPNGLAIKKTDGKLERFVVNNRKIWKAEIEKIKAQPISN